MQWSVAVLAVLLPATLSAQVAGDTLRDSTAQRLQGVMVTEARAAAVAGGASAVVIRTAALRSSPAPLLEQALREAPFVHVRQNTRGEMELSVRGSDSRQAAVLMNGVPITLGWDHRTDPSLIPITGSTNLVIVRGLGSLLNGPNTLGGTIEVNHGVSSNGVWGGAGIDENSAYVASLGAARRLGALAGGSLDLNAGFAHRQRDGVSLPKDAVDATASDGLRTNSDLEETDGFALLRWSGAMGRSLGLTLSGFNAERGVPPEEHISGPRLWRYPYQSRAIAAVSGSTGSLTTPFGFGSLDIGIGYNSGRTKISIFDDRQYTTLDDEELGDERTWTGRAILSHSLPAGASLRAGVTAADIHYTETLSPDPGVDYRQTMTSAGAEVEVPFGATKLAGGLVYDRTTTPVTGGREPGQDPFDAMGWRAGLSHAVNADVRLHASASQRSRFPALRELYSGAANRFRPNPDLDAETLFGFEAGVTASRAWGPIPQGTFQLIGFRHNLDDAVIRITRPDLGTPAPFMRVNRDRIVTTGAELLAGLTFGSDRDRAITVTGDAMFQKITITDITVAGQPTRHAENNPAQRGSLELGVPLVHGVRGILNARYTGKQYCLNADTNNEDTISAQTETDVAAERRFTVRGGLFSSLRALISVDNVTDASVFDQCGLVQPGRTLRIMVTFR